MREGVRRSSRRGVDESAGRVGGQPKIHQKIFIRIKRMVRVVSVSESSRPCDRQQRQVQSSR